MHTIKPGAIGVMLNDNRSLPKMYKLLDLPHHMGIAYFEPLHDIGATVANPIKQFWHLIDQLP